MPGYLGKTTNLSRDGVGAIAQSERDTMWGNITGTVVSFDPITQTASVQPDYRPTGPDGQIDMPMLEQVPVRFPRAGGFVITTPVQPGDKVALRPQMRSTDAYHSGGGYSAAGDARTFALSDMEAHLDGGEPLTEPIANFNPSAMELRTEDGSFAMRMTPDGTWSIVGAQGDVLDLIASLAELLADDGLQIAYGSSAGTGHQLQFRSQYATIAAKLRGTVAS